MFSIGPYTVKFFPIIKRDNLVKKILQKKKHKRKTLFELYAASITWMQRGVNNPSPIYLLYVYDV